MMDAEEGRKRAKATARGKTCVLRMTCDNPIQAIQLARLLNENIQAGRVMAFMDKPKEPNGGAS